MRQWWIAIASSCVVLAAVAGQGQWLNPRYMVDITIDLPAGEVPFRPVAAQLYKQRNDNFRRDNPSISCLPVGLPRLAAYLFPYKIIQTTDLVAILYEAQSTFRQIFLDGRPLPSDPNPTWMGYSVGRWEGDTLVVETTGFNDKSWLDGAGHPHSDAMRVAERDATSVIWISKS